MYVCEEEEGDLRRRTELNKKSVNHKNELINQWPAPLSPAKIESSNQCDGQFDDQKLP